MSLRFGSCVLKYGTWALLLIPRKLTKNCLSRATDSRISLCRSVIGLGEREDTG